MNKSCSRLYLFISLYYNCLHSQYIKLKLDLENQRIHIPFETCAKVKQGKCCEHLMLTFLFHKSPCYVRNSYETCNMLHKINKISIVQQNLIIMLNISSKLISFSCKFMRALEHTALKIIL